jgi:dTDP-4-dehydrorhamnose reductase
VKVVILGAGGQLGSELSLALQEFETLRLARSDLDVCAHQQVRQVLEDSGPEVVINTTAFHQVDECEKFPAEAFRVNAIAVWNLATVCRSLNCRLVQISTDYVFAGERCIPYSEEDIPSPVNVYGVSKLAGEHMVRLASRRNTVVRTSGLYGPHVSRSKGGNFVDVMIELAASGSPIRVVDDQVLSPTYAADLAGKIKELVLAGGEGLYHITNSGECSWYEFAAKIFEVTGLSPRLSRISSQAYGQVARRPAYSVLANSRLEAAGLNRLRPWEDALAAYLASARRGTA